MARFYKTASADPLEYMYKLNVPLMADVIKTNDSYITQNLQQTSQLSNLANSFPYLQDDEGRAKEITQQYSKQIDDITDSIKSDPTNWRKQLDPIRTLSRDLQQNYRTGEISKISENYGKYKKTSDYIDEQMKGFTKDGKGISADRARAYKQYFMNQFKEGSGGKGTNYDPKTGQYNSINVFDPMNNVDVRKSLSEELDKMKADGEVRITDQVTGAGEYLNKQTGKWEGITPEKILRIATDRLNNPQLMDYLKQDTIAGIVSGVYDTDPTSSNYGKFIAPYSYDKVGLTTTEQSMVDNMKKKIESTKNQNTKDHLQEQLDSYTKQLSQRTQLNWNNGSYLAPILRGITDEFSYSKTEQGNDISANPIWSDRFNQSQANDRNNKNIASREKLQQQTFDHADDAMREKQKWDLFVKMVDFNLDSLKPKKGTITSSGTKKTTTSSGKTVPTVEPPKPKLENDIVGAISTSPFYWTTENKDKMSIALNDEINVSKNSITQLEKSLADLKKTSPDNKIMIANAENQISSAKAKQNSLESQRELALNYAISQWAAKGNKADNVYDNGNERLVRDYLSGNSKKSFDDANAEFIKAEQTRKQLGANTQPNVQGDPEKSQWLKNVYYPARARKADAETRYNSGQIFFNNEVKKYSDEKLEKAAKETTNKNEIVGTTDTQDQRVIQFINTSPSDYKIRNSEGKETNLSFEHGTASTKPEDFKINGVATTTGLGDKGIELAVTIKGKNYIITPKDDGGRLNSFFSQEFRKSKDKNVKNIGNILGSPTAGVIADMLTEVRMNTNPQYGSKDSWTYKLIPNPANPKETLKVRARSINTGGGEPKWELQFETTNSQLIMKNAGKGEGYTVDGNTMKAFVPLSSSKNNDGVYHNLEDILSIFPSDQ